MYYQSPAEIGKQIGKERRWIIARCKKGELPYIMENGRYLIDADKTQDALSLLEKSFKPMNSNLKYPKNPSSKLLYRL